MYKLIVFVPKEDIENFKESLFKTGAGSLGNYSCCAFETEGIGQFKPNNKANPSIGESNTLERVKEVKLEVLVDESIIEDTIRAIYKFHPYEEPAFDLIKLSNNKFKHLRNK